MAKRLSVPSLQHLARTWFDSPQLITKEYVKLAENSPTFSYQALFSAVRDLLLFGQPYDDIVEGIKRGVGREKIRDNFLEVLPLIRNHFDGIRPDYIQPVSTRYYSAGRGLMVPFRPPIFYGIGGQTFFPWFSFWKRNPLTDKRLALFTTLVKEMLRDDPDLEDAQFEVLDFSAPKGSKERELVVHDASKIPVIPEEEVVEMLAAFAEGFYKAQEEIDRKSRREDRDDDRPFDPNQPDLFKR